MDHQTDDMAAQLANVLEMLNVHRRKIQSSGQKPTELPADLKAAILQLICS